MPESMHHGLVDHVEPCMPERVLWNPDYPGPPCKIEPEDIDADESWMGWVAIQEGCAYCPRDVYNPEARPSWWLSWMVGNTHRPKAIAPSAKKSQSEILAAMELIRAQTRGVDIDADKEIHKLRENPRES